MRHFLKGSVFVVATLMGMVLTPDAASAQRNCKKGIPCGGTCIAASKTCHVGTPAARPTARPESTSDVAPKVIPQSKPHPLFSVASSGQWVGSSRGHTYYRDGCSGASKLAKSNLLHFKSEADAKAAGFKRSAQKGC